MWVGCYLKPPLIFTERDSPGAAYLEREEMLSILARLNPLGQEVIVTKLGGLFARVPNRDLADEGWLLRKTWQPAVAACNQVIFELAVMGGWSRPFSAWDLEPAAVDARNARLIGAQGEDLLEKLAIQSALEPGREKELLTLRQLHPSALEKAARHVYSGPLHAIDEVLPRVAAFGYWFVRRHMHPEAIVQFWTACERLIDFLWMSQVVSSAPDAARRRSLSDTRTYNTAVRLEVLESRDLLPNQLRSDLDALRRTRNAWVHGLDLAAGGAPESFESLMLHVMKVVARTE